MQEGLRGRPRARLPRHQPAGAGARAGDPQGRVRVQHGFQRHGARPRPSPASGAPSARWRASSGWSRTAIAWSPTTAPMAARSCSISTSISSAASSGRAGVASTNDRASRVCWRWRHLRQLAADAQPARPRFYAKGTKQRAVRFAGSDGATLAGTLLLPIWSELEKVPGVVLVVGQRPDRPRRQQRAGARPHRSPEADRRAFSRGRHRQPALRQARHRRLDVQAATARSPSWSASSPGTISSATSPPATPSW